MQTRGSRTAQGRPSLPSRSRAAYGAGMHFRVLGPIEVAGDDGPLTLGGPRQRAVLAHLIIHANQVLPTETLIDLVWGDEPPEAARNALQSYASHLRKALGGTRLEGKAPGYVLHLDPQELDAARFELLLQEARTMDGRPGRGDVIREALTLWRGPAFADLAADRMLAGEIARLDELRLQAVEERIAVDLDDGRHAEVVAELESLTRELPLRERLWESLMLALYRVGRPADALGAYQRARELLADELGVDPSPELQRLHERILRQDPDLELKGEALRGYRLLEQIGEGAFGVVHRAVQPQVGREVAIKAIHPDLANHPDFVRRFEREAQLVARLEHPHIVPLYDYWREPDAAYLVMRLLRGGSLDDLIEQGPIDASQAAGIFDQVAAALSAAHGQGVVHRDVKPGNVLLDEQGNAYLTDFGVALDAGSPEKTMGTMLRGTPAYLSPEQIRLEPASPRSDVYALGIVLYEMLTGSYPFEESSLQALLDRHLNDDLPSVRESRPELPPTVDAVVARATAKDTVDRFGDATSLAAAFRAAIDEATAAPIPRGKTRNPYKGLRAFAEADAHDFFGREQLTERLVRRLAQEEPASRFLALVGPSGSGKSSVVRAGLVPALRRGAIPGSDRWYVIEMMPGPDPFNELESTLLGVAVDPPTSLMEYLGRDELGLVEAADRILPDRDGELLIVLDQLEEVFTLVPDDGERVRFLDCIRAAVLEPGSRIRVVATLRADFYDQPLSVPGFGDLLAARNEAITPMAHEELELAIVAPADDAGLVVEPMLLAAMIGDVAEQPGALPLVQFALTELAERADDGILTIDAYRDIGRVSGALAGRADLLFEALNEEGRAACRQLFLRLVTLGEGSEDTRRRVRRTELVALADARTMGGVIEAFGRHRLLSFDRDPSTREPTVEIAHEALLRAWSRLREWVDEARDDIRAEQKLAAAAAEWMAADRDPSFLLRGGRLEQASAWLESTTLAPSEQETALLDASLEQRERERTTEHARVEKERALERRSVRRLRALVAGLTVAALVAAVLTVIATNEGDRAEREARVAHARELAAAAMDNVDEDPERSILLALEAVEATRPDETVLPEAEQALHLAVQADRLALTIPTSTSAVVRYSPDGTRILSPGPEPGSAYLYDATTGEVLLRILGHGTDFLSHVDYSPDGRFISTSSRTAASTKIWDARTGEELFELTVPSGQPVCCAGAFSPDGSVFASNVFFEGVRLWDLETGETLGGVDIGGVLTFSPDSSRLWISDCVGRVDLPNGGPDAFCVPLGRDEFVTDVSWPADSSRVATSLSNGTVALWEAATGDPVLTLVPGAGEIRDIELAPGGDRLAIGLGDGTAKIWELTQTSGREAFVLAGHDAGIQSMKFNPDATTLATASEDGTVKVWDVTMEAGGETQTMPGAGAAVYNASADMLAVGDLDGSVRLYDAATGAPRGTLRGDGAGPTVELATDPASSWLASARDDGTITLWDLGTGAVLRTFEVRPPVEEIALSATAGLVAALSDNQRVQIRDTSTGDLVHTLDGAYSGIAFSSDGSQLAAPFNPGYTSERMLVVVWDTQSWSTIREVEHPHFSGDVAYSADADLLVTGGVDGTVRVFDTDGLGFPRVRSMSGNLGRIASVAIDAEGRTVATVSESGLRLWDVDTGRLRLVLSEAAFPPQPGLDLGFSGDGSRLVAPTPDGAMTVYLLEPDELLRLARSSLTRGFTDQECRQYLHSDDCPA